MKKTEPRRQDACNIVVGGRTYCIDPLEKELHLLSKRWSLLVIGVLGNKETARFNQVRATIPGLSARALSDVLTALQDGGLVLRSVDAEKSPPAVAYQLTPRGSSLRGALIPLLEWAENPLAPLAPPDEE